MVAGRAVAVEHWLVRLERREAITMDSDAYTLARWQVKPGQEEEFIRV